MQQNPADELADVRAEIRRLEAREAILLQADWPRQRTGPRPGWPIRRIPQGEGEALH